MTTAADHGVSAGPRPERAGRRWYRQPRFAEQHDNQARRAARHEARSRVHIDDLVGGGQGFLGEVANLFRKVCL
ncbi:MAG TPA: hypothetical protein VI248_07740 [Kineosporiaceae bacterium]